MRCMVMVRATAESESQSGALPSSEILEAMGRFNEELMKAGVMLAGEGLKPSREGRRMRFAHGTRQVIDGPFAQTKELIAGFWLWQVCSMDEALEWARRCPPPFAGECEIEIRPLFAAAEFADIMSPELRESATRLRKRLAERPH